MPFEVFILMALLLVALSIILITPHMPRVKRFKTEVLNLFLIEIEFYDQRKRR
jgi:hypothetical protein